MQLIQVAAENRRKRREIFYVLVAEGQALDELTLAGSWKVTQELRRIEVPGNAFTRCFPSFSRGLPEAFAACVERLNRDGKLGRQHNSVAKAMKLLISAENFKADKEDDDQTPSLHQRTPEEVQEFRDGFQAFVDAIQSGLAEMEQVDNDPTVEEVVLNELLQVRIGDPSVTFGHSATRLKETLFPGAGFTWLWEILAAGEAILGIKYLGRDLFNGVKAEFTRRGVDFDQGLTDEQIAAYVADSSSSDAGVALPAHVLLLAAPTLERRVDELEHMTRQIKAILEATTIFDIVMLPAGRARAVMSTELIAELEELNVTLGVDLPAWFQAYMCRRIAAA